MTSDAGRETSTGGAATVCPNCGHEVAPGSVICGICLRPVHETRSVERSVLTARAAAERRELGRRTRRNWLLLAAALTVVAGLAYVLWFRPPSPVPLPVSTARTLQAATEAPDRWPSSGGDNGLSRASAAAPALDAPEAWRYTADSRITTPPIAGDRYLYFGVASASLVAVSRADGTEAWRVPVPGQIDAPPTLAGDRLYVTRRDGAVMAMSADTGETIWTSGDGPAYFSSAVVQDGVVYALSLGQLSAFDAENGRELWARRLDQRVSSEAGAAISGESVLAGSYRRAVLFDRRTAVQTYFYSLPQANYLMVQGNRAVVTGNDRVVAFGLDSRRPWWDGLRTAWGQLWLFGMAPMPPPQPRHWIASADRGSHPPALARDVLVLVTAAGGAQGVDFGSGEQRWQAELGPVTAPPLATADGVLVVQPEGLVLLDPATGDERARREMPGARLSAATVTASATYLVSDDRSILALR